MKTPEQLSIRPTQFDPLNNLNKLYMNAGLIDADGSVKVQGNLFLYPEIMQPRRSYNTGYIEGFRIPSPKEGLAIIEQMPRILSTTYPPYLNYFKEELDLLYWRINKVDEFFREFWCFEGEFIRFGIYGSQNTSLTSMAWEILVKGSL